MYDYDPKTGVFVWKKLSTKALQKRHEGKVAGTNGHDGRRRIYYRGTSHNAARIAWVYMNGPIPDGMEVDHIDCDCTNDAIDNLRLATSSQQKMNKGAQSNNRAGLKGAFYHACRPGKKWRSQIKVKGLGLKFLGYYATAQEAHEAYIEACQKYFGEFARW